MVLQKTSSVTGQLEEPSGEPKEDADGQASKRAKLEWDLSLNKNVYMIIISFKSYKQLIVFIKITFYSGNRISLKYNVTNKLLRNAK